MPLKKKLRSDSAEEKANKRERKKNNKGTTIIVVEDLSLTPPLFDIETPGEQAVVIDQQQPSTSSVCVTTSVFHSTQRRRKDVHPRSEKIEKKQKLAQEESDDEVFLRPLPNDEILYKQLTPSMAEKQRDRVRKRQRRSEEAVTTKRRRQEEHASRERERVNQLSPNVAERRKDRKAALEKLRLQQNTCRQQKRAADRAYFKRWFGSLTPHKKSTYYLCQRFRYAKKHQMRVNYAARRQQQMSRIRKAFKLGTAARIKADIEDRPPVRLTADYRRRRLRFLRKQQIEVLADRYLDMGNSEQRPRRRHTQAQKRAAERKMATLVFTADELMRIVQSDMHNMFERFDRNVLAPAEEAIKDVVDEDEKELHLARSYGGKFQFHIKTMELLELDHAQFLYRPIADIIKECIAKQTEEEPTGENDQDDSQPAAIAQVSAESLGIDHVTELLKELGEGFLADVIDGPSQQPADNIILTYDMEPIASAAEKGQPCATISTAADLISAAVGDPEAAAETEEDRACWARLCSDDCVIPPQWATLLHDAFLKMKAASTAEELCQAMQAFENCDQCKSGQLCGFEQLDMCTNTHRLLYLTMVHYRRLRTTLRRYNEMRQSFLWLRNVENAQANGDPKWLMELIDHPNLNGCLLSRIQESMRREKSSIHSEHAIRREFATLIDAFKNEIRDFTAYPCDVCWQLNKKSTLKEIQVTPIIKTWLPDDYSKETVQICNTCSDYTDYTDPPTSKNPAKRKKPSMPPMALINDMGVDEIPQELQNLNWVETLLIQLAKSFQTIIHLKPYGHYHLDLVHASRGLAIHLPLPLQGTLDHTLTKLPSTEGLKILVDKVAAKTFKAYRTVVRVRQVMNALRWLKEHNPLYECIEIDENVNFDDVVEFTSNESEEADAADKTEAVKEETPPITAKAKCKPTTTFSSSGVQKSEPMVIDLVNVSDTTAEPIDYWICEDQVLGERCVLLLQMRCRDLVLKDDGWLDDEVINGAQQILSIQFKNEFAGWASTHASYSAYLGTRCMKCVAAGLDAIQMHHVPGHWLLSCVVNGIIYVFDSFKNLYSDVDIQLCQVYHHFAVDGYLTVRTVSCQQQLDGALCGVMAIAFAVEIASHGLVAAITARFDKPQMRKWLFTCLEAKTFIESPQLEQVVPVTTWTERALIIPDPAPCLTIALDEDRMQRQLGTLLNSTAPTEVDSNQQPGDVFEAEANNPSYQPFHQQPKAKKAKMVKEEDDPELKSAAPEEQLYLLTQQGDLDINIQHYGVMDMFTKLPKETDAEIYKMKPVEGVPISESDMLIDVKCHPKLFPKGRFGMHHPRDPIVLPAMFIRNRMRLKDPRFRRDMEYIFSAVQRQDVLTVQRGIYTTMQTKRLPDDLTAGKIKQLLEQNDLTIERSLRSILQKCRGTAQFWNVQKGHLQAMDANAGPATLWLTFSAKEYSWTDVREVLEQLNQDIPNVANMRQGFLCCKDPMTVSNQFYNRFMTLMRKVIMNKFGPFGEVLYFYWRIEYQARGAPHVHMKLWIKGAPIVGDSSDEEVIKWIAKHITCRLPSPITSPELYRLVIENQMHSCRAYCKRLDKRCASGWRCRFSFPRPVQVALKLNPLKRALRRKHGRVEKLYQLQRTQKETFINPYNPLLLYLWRSNIDVQYIGEVTQVINAYITKYATKAEKMKTAELWAAVDKSKTARGQLLSFVLRLFRSREIGAYEACDKVSGHLLHKSNAQVDFLNTNKKKDRWRRLVDKKEIDEMEPTSTHFFKNNFVDTYYPRRPEALEDKSLFHVFSWYTFQREKPQKMVNSKQEPHYELPFDLGYLVKRLKARLVKSFLPVPDKPETTEDYFRCLLMMFKPWRDDDELMDEGSTSFREDFEKNQAVFSAEANKYMSQRQRMEKTQELMKQLREEQEAAENNPNPLDDSQYGQLVNDKDKFSCLSERVVDRDELDTRVNKLNPVQREIFDEIIELICHQDQHDRKLCQCSDLKPPMLRMISGVAGTGKSFLIECLADKLTLLFPDAQGGSSAVAIGAPTGVAAFNVKGQTLHALFKLIVDKTGESTATKQYASLDRDYQVLFKLIYRNLRLIIIDEVSMVSNVILLQIHSRLNEILRDTNDWALFGGVNMVFFGDLLQLKPVSNGGCYEAVYQTTMALLFGNVLPKINLWSHVSYSELTTNMRQRDDLAYSEMLERIRIGSPTEADIRALEQRQLHCVLNVNQPTISKERLQLAVDHFQKMRAEHTQGGTGHHSQPVALFPTRVQVDEFNTAMLNLEGKPIVTTMAEDSGIELKTAQKTAQKQKGKASVTTIDTPQKSTDPAKTGGLVAQLNLCIGCRVMLRRNINTERGLTNGAMGTVTNFKLAPGCAKKIDAVVIRFDSDPAEEIVLDKMEAPFSISKEFTCTRRQFPLILAYGMTIHKSQGMTLDVVFANLGTEVFEPGMAYVSLSRVQRLNNLYLIDFDAAYLWCYVAGYDEYQRLRPLAVPTPLPKLAAANVLPANVKPRRRRLIPRLHDFYYGSSKANNNNNNNTKKKRSRKVPAQPKRLSAKKKSPAAKKLQPPVNNKTPTVAQPASKPAAAKAVVKRPMVAPTKQNKQLSTSLPIIRLSNSNTIKVNCYSNTAVQLFRHLPQFVAALPDAPRSKIRDVLLETLVGAHRDTTPLRKAVRRGFEKNQMHDAAEFFLHILNELKSPAIEVLFGFEQKLVVTCRECHHRPTRDLSPVIEKQLNLHRSQVKQESFQLLLDRCQQREIEAMSCMQNDGSELMHDHDICHKITIQDHQKYLLLQLNKFCKVGSDIVNMDTMITNFDANDQLIFGHHFRAVAAVAHWGSTTDFAHYVAWGHEDHGWFLFNDAHDPEWQHQLPSGLQDIVTLIMEKL